MPNVLFWSVETPGKPLAPETGCGLNAARAPVAWRAVGTCPLVRAGVRCHAAALFLGPNDVGVSFHAVRR